MASPVDAGRIATNIATAVTPWTINLPGSISAGDLLILAIRDPATVSAPGWGTAGWTALVGSVADASDDGFYIGYKAATGSETSTFSLTPGASAKAAAICWRITGAIDPATQPPQISTVGTGTTAANSADPPSVTPTGGSKDYLFLAIMGLDGELNTPTVSPTNYSTITTANSGTAGAVATNCSLGGGSRQLTASTEDPGVFTHPAANSGWMAATVAIHPVVAAATTVIPVGFATGRDY